MSPVTRFFVLTYVLSWTCFVCGGAAVLFPPLAGLHWPLLLAGAFSPSAAAIYLTAHEEGRRGVNALLRRVIQWNVRVRWYLFAAGYMAAVKIAVAITYRVATGTWPRFGDEAWYVILAATVAATIFGGPLGEELGWRGYALPRLAARFGMARASIILGVVWAVWHLPVFFIPGIDKFGQSLPVYVLQVTALSVAMAWLYQNTGGSLLLAILMHSAVNQTKDIVPSVVPGATNPFSLSSSPVAWLTLAFLWILAGYFLVRMRRGGSDPKAAAVALSSVRAPVRDEESVALMRAREAR